ncbi:MAG: DUF1361 domain-containing protein [Caldilineaceae bacterium]
MTKIMTPYPLRSKLPLLTALLLSSVLSVAMWVARVVYTHHGSYFGLNWNLVLAWIPLFLALAAWLLVQRSAFLPLVLLLLAGWLLFLPNAAYIVTDLIHLHPRDGSPFWYDALMVFSFAWNGLILGMTSVWIVQSLVERWLGALAGWLLAGGALFASAFGIYLGRFLRWNSWDLFTEPHGLLHDILFILRNPMQNQRTLAVTALLSGMLLVIYVTMTLLARVRWESR